MIAVSSSGKSFRALAQYLISGRTGAEFDRVAWSGSRNLPTDDPELAAKIMRGTAAKSDRVEKPVYHIAISFDPGDKVDRASMERVADKVLARLGLSEYQATIVAHRDREHPHVHIFVNRVHPETGKAWERWQDQPLIQEVLRDEEASLGLRLVPGSLQSSRQVGRQLELHGTDRSAQTADAAHPAERGGPRGKVEALRSDIQAYEDVVTLTREHYAVRLEAEAAIARVRTLDERVKGARDAEEAFQKALRSVYLNPESARREFARVVDQHGLQSAVEGMRDNPERYGVLKTIERRQLFGLSASHEDTAARASAPNAAALGGAAARTLDEARMSALQARLQRAEEVFARDMRALFDEPAMARAQFKKLVRRDGTEQALRTLGMQPADLGSVHSAPERGAKQVEKAADTAARSGRELLRIREEWVGQAVANLKGLGFMMIDTERSASRSHADGASDALRGLTGQLKLRPSLPDLQALVARGLTQLLPHELRRLKASLTVPHLAIVAKIRSTMREAMLGRDDEHHG